MPAAPTLPSRDLDATLRFYRSLGFAGELRPQFPEYLILGRDDLQLHFFAEAGVDPATTIAGAYLYVADADALYEEWAAVEELPQGCHGAPRLQGPPQDTPYGLREFALVDPDGSLLRVGS